MNKFFSLLTFLIFPFISLFSQSIYLTSSGGSFSSEKWMSISTGPNGTGTLVWGQSPGTIPCGTTNGGLLNDEVIDLSAYCGQTLYINAYDRYADTWDGTTYEIWTAAGQTGTMLANNGGASPDDGTDSDASSSFCDTQSEELESSEAFTVPACPCTLPTVTYNIVPDCGNAQFSVDVVLAGLGTGTAVNISDGTTTFETNVGTGTYNVGPFAAGSTQTITVDGSPYGGCSTNSSSLTEACNCATVPVATVNSTNLNCSSNTYDIQVTVTSDGSGDINKSDILIDGVVVQTDATTNNLYTFSVGLGAHSIDIQAEGSGFVTCNSTTYNVAMNCNGSDLCSGAPDLTNTCFAGDLTSASVDGGALVENYMSCGNGNTIALCGANSGFTGSSYTRTDHADIWYAVYPDGSNEFTVTISNLSGGNVMVLPYLSTGACPSTSGDNTTMESHITNSANTLTGGSCPYFSSDGSITFNGADIVSATVVYLRVMAWAPNGSGATNCETLTKPTFDICASVPLPNDESNGILQYAGPTTPYTVINAAYNIQNNPVCQNMDQATISGTSLPADCGGTPFDLGGKDLWYYVEIPDGQVDTRLKLNVTFDNAGESVYAIISNGPTSLQECTVLSSSSNGETVSYVFNKTISEGTTYDPTHYFIRLVQPATNGISTFCVNAELVVPNNDCDFFNQVTIDYRLFDGTNPVVNTLDFAFATASGVALPGGGSSTDPDLWYIVDPVLTTDANGLNTWSGYLDMIASGLGAGESVELILYRRNGYSGNCVDYAADYVSRATISSDGTVRISCLDIEHGSAGVGDGYILRVIQTSGTDISFDLSAQPDEVAPPTNDLCSLLYDGTNLSFEASYYNITNTSQNASFQESRNCEGISEVCSGTSLSHDRDLWFYFEIPNNSCPDYTVSTTIDEATITYDAGDAFRDARVYVYADCDASTIMGCATLDGAGESFTITGLSPGETYFVRVMPSSLNSNQTYAFDIATQLGPVRPCHDRPDAAASAGSVSVGFDRSSCPTITMSAQGATETSNVADGWHDVWYTIVAPDNGGPYVLQEGYLSLYLEAVSGHTMKIELYEVASSNVANNRLGSATTDAFDEARLHVGHLVPGKTYYIRVAHNEPNLALNNELVEFRLCAYETSSVSNCPFNGGNLVGLGVECNSSCTEFYKIDIPEGTASAFYRIEVIGNNGQQLDFRLRYQGMDSPSNEGNLTDIDHPCNAGANVPVESSGPLSDPGTCNGGSGFWKTYNLIGPVVGQRNYYYIEVMHPVDVVGCGGLDVCEVRFLGPYPSVADANTGGTGTIADCFTLPINLTSFEAAAEENHNQIKWTWEEAVDFHKFVLERSETGMNFEVIHEITLNEIQGQSYKFLDENFSKNSYYRLKMVNTDASFEYSDVRVVQRNVNNRFNIYPNPLKGEELTINSSFEQSTLKIYDLNGRLISRFENIQTGKTTLPLQLPAGVYSVVLTNSQFQITERLIILD